MEVLRQACRLVPLMRVAVQKHVQLNPFWRQEIVLARRTIVVRGALYIATYLSLQFLIVEGLISP